MVQHLHGKCEDQKFNSQLKEKSKENLHENVRSVGEVGIILTKGLYLNICISIASTWGYELEKAYLHMIPQLCVKRHTANISKSLLDNYEQYFPYVFLSIISETSGRYYKIIIKIPEDKRKTFVNNNKIT